MNKDEIDISVLTPSDFLPEEFLGVDPIIKNEKDGSILILIPGEKFLASDLPFEVQLSSFYAGLTTVTNAQYKRFIDASEYRPPDKADFGSPVWQGRTYPAEKANHPVVCISWYDAQAYCKWAGLRLPTELEWEKAARFTDGRKYPWGKKWDKNLCRNGINRRNETTCPIFSYPKGVNPWGLYQMSGNVWEWCQDRYDSEAYERYKAGNLTLPASGEFCVVRGGSWRYADEGSFRCAYRINFGPSIHFYNGGFRVFRSLTP